MPAHGSVIIGDQSQDELVIYVDDTGGSRDFGTGEQPATNTTGSTLNAGDVVNVGYNEEVQATSSGTRATGNVDSGGTKIEITDSGDTALTGTVNISSSYGENEGFAEAEGVTCCNINGEAAYLS